MKSYFAKISLAGASIMVSVLLAMLFYAPVKTAKKDEPVVPSKVKMVDKKLGWKLRPNSSAYSERTGYKIEYRINSNGLRDDETEYENVENNYRILLLGDSRTFGFGVPIQKHFSTIIEGYFNNLEVVNMGVGGYGVDQELLTYEYEGIKYNPDIVICYISHFGSHRHMHDKLWGLGKPFFELVDKKLFLKNSPVRKNSNKREKNDSNSNFIKSVLVKWRLISNENLSKDYQTQKSRDERNRKDDKFLNNMYELAGAIILQMNKVSIENDSKFILVTEVRKLHEMMQANDINSLYLSESLKNPKYALPDNLGHINEAGNGVLAWKITEYLINQNFVPENYRN